MKKCKICGKKHLSYHPCGIEEELESILPKKDLSAIRRKPVFYLFISIAVAATFILLSLSLLYSRDTIKAEKDAIFALNLSLTRRSNELSVLERILSETEEGKAALEISRKETEAENASLERGLEQSKDKLTKAQNDIIESTYYIEKIRREAEEMMKEAEADRVNLAQKEEFVAHFGELDRLIDSFNVSATKVLSDLENNNTEGVKTNLAITQDYYYQILNKITELRN